MGAIADAMARYAQPVVDSCDGSPEELQKSYMLSQLCWNAAVLPDDQRAAFLETMRPAFNMDNEEFQEFIRDVVEPMIRRHHEMFPAMRRTGSTTRSAKEAVLPIEPPPSRIRIEKKYPGTGRNERCPCGSGRKYKVCCGR
jgi:hypothetical protein